MTNPDPTIPVEEREAIARIIDPEAFTLFSLVNEKWAARDALSKADAILGRGDLGAPPRSGSELGSGGNQETRPVASSSSRLRQVEAEGWTPEHDDEHTAGEMAAAAAAYAFNAYLAASPRFFAADPLGFWPWDHSWWKPKGARRDLIRAAALIVAEIERLDRQGASPSSSEGGE